MQIERIAVRLRRRTAWEALDLGHGMLRAWAGPAYRTWLGTYWVVGVLLLAVFWNHQQIAIAILWWLKPLFDRILLFTFSRSLFRTPTTYRDVLKAIPGIVRHSSLFSGLTFRRLSLARSFLLPVWQLENQKGKDARARFKVLSRRTRGVAVWLTIVGAHLNAILAFSLIILVETLIPGDDWGLFFFADGWGSELAPERQIIASLLTMLAESLVEPLYVASGFSLYLHRRSELEGWDIEVAFRRLAGRQTEGKTPMARTALGLVAILGLSLGLALAPQPSQAEGNSPPTPPPVQSQAASPAKKAIEAVLADPVFGQKTQEMRWQMKKKPDKPVSDEPEWLRALLRFIEFSAEIGKALGWIVALLLAVGLIYLVVTYREKLFGIRNTSSKPPDFLFGLDVRPESLPDDIAAAAREALAAGRIELALSLLYRGSLVTLLHRDQVEFQPGDTEDNCRHRVKGHLDNASEHYFGNLLDAWLITAYAHQPPAVAEVEGLCQDWHRHFGLATATGRKP